MRIIKPPKNRHYNRAYKPTPVVVKKEKPKVFVAPPPPNYARCVCGAELDRIEPDTSSYDRLFNSYFNLF